jgi:hypothetical protein
MIASAEKRIEQLKEAYINQSNVILVYPDNGRLTIDWQAIPTIIQIILEVERGKNAQ